MIKKHQPSEKIIISDSIIEFENEKIKIKPISRLSFDHYI